MKLQTKMEHWSNLWILYKLYGREWHRPVHWHELPKFLRPAK